MDPKELMNLTLTAASVAEKAGFRHTAEALIDIVIILANERTGIEKFYPSEKFINNHQAKI